MLKAFFKVLLLRYENQNADGFFNDGIDNEKLQPFITKWIEEGFMDLNDDEEYEKCLNEWLEEIKNIKYNKAQLRKQFWYLRLWYAPKFNYS